MSAKTSGCFVTGLSFPTKYAGPSCSG
jgi:hypothetical protein